MTVIDFFLRPDLIFRTRLSNQFERRRGLIPTVSESGFPGSSPLQFPVSGFAQLAPNLHPFYIDWRYAEAPNILSMQTAASQPRRAQ